MHKAVNGELLLLWSSFIDNVYAQGIARATSGDVLGLWIQDETPLYTKDGAHVMLFCTFEEELMLTFILQMSDLLFFLLWNWME